MAEADPDRVVEALGIGGRRGRYWCPFCQWRGASEHKTPDFSCRQGFVCFKCGFKGDVFTFVQGVLRVDFVKSVEYVQRVYLGYAEEITGSPSRRRPKKKSFSRRGYESLSEAIDSILRALGDGWLVTSLHKYSDDLYQARMDSGDEKTYRPFARENGKWYSKAPAKPWPLYRVTEV